MPDPFTKEDLWKFLAENLPKNEDELLAVVAATFAMMKAKYLDNPEVAEILPDLERLMRAGIEHPDVDFKDMVEEYVLAKLG